MARLHEIYPRFLGNAADSSFVTFGAQQLDFERNCNAITLSICNLATSILDVETEHRSQWYLAQFHSEANPFYMYDRPKGETLSKSARDLVSAQK